MQTLKQLMEKPHCMLQFGHTYQNINQESEQQVPKFIFKSGEKEKNILVCSRCTRV